MTDVSVVSLTAAPEVLAAFSLVCIATVKLVDSAWKRDWEACAKIVGCALFGSLLALFIPDMKVITGLLFGLSGSGLITTVSKLADTKIVPAGPADVA